ncbi:IS5 family transposase [Nocardiopsis tropica]|uniref:IS5 family transposase n=1 Tax=Nocardiopsis tropica TaxID=109330 RepID=A0ABV2A534_9ACTN
MPAVPSCIIEPLREEFLAQLPPRTDTHPLGCHNPRIPDHVVFDKLIRVLVCGTSYERAADATCSATTLRRRRDEWITHGMGQALHHAVLNAYDRLIGLDLEHLCADGCQTKAPSGGECAGRSPVDRGKQGLKRSQLTDGYGIPLITHPAPANIRDHTLLPATLDGYDDLATALGPLPEHPALSLDAGYDYRWVHEHLAERGISARIVPRGARVPIHTGGRWVVERTNAWMNDFGKLARCTERRRACVEFYLCLASAIITVRSLIRRARYLYRWDTRPCSPRLR